MIMDEIARLLERAGNAGDREAEALALVARELRLLRAAQDDLVGKLQEENRQLGESSAALRAEVRDLRGEIQGIRDDLRVLLESKRTRKAG